MIENKVFVTAFENANIKDTTRKPYIDNLKSLQKYCNGTTLENILQNPDTYFPQICDGAKNAKKIIREGRDELGSVLTLVKTILSLFKYTSQLKEKNWQDIKTIWLKIFDDLQKKLITRAENNVALSHNMLWKDILDKYHKTQPGTPENCVLALYCEIPPRRQEDYWLLLLEKNINEKSTGFLDLKNNTMTITHYKTVDKYKIWTSNLPIKLVEAIKEYLVGKNQKYLFCKQNGEPFTSLASFTSANNTIIKKALGNPHASVNTLRHAAASETAYSRTMTIAEKKIVSLNMGHSIEMQSKYLIRDNPV